MSNPHKLGFRIAGLIEAIAEGLGIVALLAVVVGAAPAACLLGGDP